MIATTFYKLTFISEPYSLFYSGRSRKIVDWVCECGNIGKSIYSPKSNNYPHSCSGCKSLIFTDVFKAKKMRGSYRSMLKRCYEKPHQAYKYYGGKGIKVCDDWLKGGFPVFYKDMEGDWFEGATLDRLKNNKDYYKHNCRWATMAIQQRNKDCVKVTEKDVLFIRASNLKQQQLADMFGVRSGTISRIKNFKRWKI